jgi:hypothetical protein
MKIQTLFCAAVLAVPMAASAATIDFNTDGGGAPFVGASDSFVAAEYTGVTINDSDPAVGSSFVNLINPGNVGTSISGYYMNIGAFAGRATFADFKFSTSVSSVSFDFADATGLLSVLVFDDSDNIISSSITLGTDNFLNQAGFNIKAGSFAVSGVGNISRIVLVPNSNEALIVDNLAFTPVPVPAALPLLGGGLLSLLGMRRRKLAA